MDNLKEIHANTGQGIDVSSDAFEGQVHNLQEVTEAVAARRPFRDRIYMYRHPDGKRQEAVLEAYRLLLGETGKNLVLKSVSWLDRCK